MVLRFYSYGTVSILAASLATEVLIGSLTGSGSLHFLFRPSAEVYINLTPAESERLRIVSYQKQLARGYKHPGSAGITADRIGDAHWAPPANIPPNV